MTEIRVPQLGESVTEATIATWFVKKGDTVEQDQTIAELETDKVTVEVNAPTAGTITEIVAQEGDTVEVDALLGQIGEGDGAPAKKEETPKAKEDNTEDDAQANEGGDTVDIPVPSLGESVTEATVGSWSVKEGDSVNEGDIIGELETDKVSLEVNAPASGTIAKLLVGEGDTVEAGGKLAEMTTGAGGKKKQSKPEPASSDDDQGPQTAKSSGDKKGEDAPSAKKIMAENNIDPKSVKGSGRDGRIMKEDALAAVANIGKSGSSAKSAPAAASNRKDDPREERVKMTKLRQTIARRLKESQNTAAMLTTYNEADMSGIMALRNEYKDQFLKKHGVKLGFMSFFVKACCHALNEVPDVNAEIDGTDVIYKNYVNMGVAVGTPSGLVVPVVRDAHEKSFATIEKEIGELGKKGRDGKLSMADMAGGSFTISNGGVYGSLMSSPILNPPQSGILGMHKIQDRPMVENGQIVIKPMMYLALSYDHRIVDGKGAVTFLVRVKEALEDPRRLLMDL